MVVVFVEYQVPDEMWESYVSSIPEIRAKLSGPDVLSHVFLSSGDQPGLVVEVIQVREEKAAEEIRRRVAKEGRIGNVRPRMWAFHSIEEDM